MAEAMTKNYQGIWYDAGNRPWRLYQKPFRVAPRIYYVGNTWVGAYLIDTGEGLVLIDTTVFETVYLVLESIRDLGFDPHNIQHILLSHCHIDRTGGVNPIKAISGAKVWQSKEDTAFMSHPANQELGNDFKMIDYDVDCFYNNNTVLQFGDVSIRTLLTPGHTPGTTTFFITVPDESGHPLVVAMHGGVGPNTMTNEYYEKLGEDKALRTRFIQDCDALKSIHVDISIPSHPAHGDLLKRIGADPMDFTPLIDPSEWARFLETRKGFAAKLDT